MSRLLTFREVKLHFFIGGNAPESMTLLTKMLVIADLGRLGLEDEVRELIRRRKSRGEESLP